MTKYISITLPGAVWDLLPYELRRELIREGETLKGVGRRVSASGTREQWLEVHDALCDLWGERNEYRGGEYQTRKKAIAVAVKVMETVLGEAQNLQD